MQSKHLLLLTFLALWGCSEKAPDPCAALTPVSADFDMYDGNTKIDTFILPAKITFKAKDSTAQSYAWSFPNGENTSDKQQFSLTFHNETGLIPVQLILKNKPRTACFPKDDGVDTVNKSIYLIHWLETNRLPYLGTFVGSDDTNPNHKFEVYIKDFGREDPIPTPDRKFWTGVRIFNLPEGCGQGDTTIFSQSPYIQTKTYKSFDFGSYGTIYNGCATVWGNGAIESNKIVINYSYRIWNATKKDWDIITRKFTGYRKK